MSRPTEMRTPKKVLVVEDNVLDAELLLRELYKAGFTITVQQNAESALDVIGENCEQFDFAMVDLNLPGMPGLEFIRILKAKCPTMPICVITGDKDQIVWEQAIEAGSMILFPKPYNSISNLVILGILREVYRAANRTLLPPETAMRLPPAPPKPTRKSWRRDLFSAYISGASGAFASGLALLIVAPDKFNFGEGLLRTFSAVLITALVTGAIGFFAYLNKQPLPPEE